MPQNQRRIRRLGCRLLLPLLLCRLESSAMFSDSQFPKCEMLYIDVNRMCAARLLVVLSPDIASVFFFFCFCCSVAQEWEPLSKITTGFVRGITRASAIVSVLTVDNAIRRISSLVHGIFLSIVFFSFFLSFSVSWCVGSNRSFSISLKFALIDN